MKKEQDAIRKRLAYRRKHGIPEDAPKHETMRKPVPTRQKGTVAFSVSMEPHDRDTLDDWASRRNCTRGDIITRLLRSGAADDILNGVTP